MACEGYITAQNLTETVLCTSSDGSEFLGGMVLGEQQVYVVVVKLQKRKRCWAVSRIVRQSSL